MSILDEIKESSCPHYEGVGGEHVWCSWCVSAVVLRVAGEVRELSAKQLKEIAAIWEDERLSEEIINREVRDEMERNLNEKDQCIAEYQQEIDVLRADVKQLSDEAEKYELREEEYQKVIREAEWYDNRD